MTKQCIKLKISILNWNKPNIKTMHSVVKVTEKFDINNNDILLEVSTVGIDYTI